MPEPAPTLIEQAEETPIPLLDLRSQYEQIRSEVELAVLAVLRSQQMILGPEVEALETESARYCGAKFAIGVSSGTDALLMALMALGIGPGEEVITSDYSFFASGGSIARTGARPVFVDIDRKTYNLDPSLLEAAITPRTRAIMPVHLYGQCADMEAILDVAGRHGLPVIEDAAQAIGSECMGRRAGSLGLMGCFSFYPSKNLGAAGDAGLVTTNDETLAEKLKVLRNHGAEERYYHRVVGGNFRIDAIQAVILRIKLRRLEAWTRLRRENAEDYTALFRQSGLDSRGVVLPDPGEGRHVFNQYVIAVPERRDELARWLAARKIGTSVYYPLPLHRQECFGPDAGDAGRFPQSDWASAHTLALPMFPELTHDQRWRVVAAIDEFHSRVV